MPEYEVPDNFYAVSFPDPIEANAFVDTLGKDLNSRSENDHVNWYSEFSIVSVYLLGEELRCHFGLLFKGENFQCRGQHYDYLLYHHFSKRHHFVAGSKDAIFAHLCQGLPKGDVERVLGTRAKYSTIDDSEKKHFHVYKIQLSLKTPVFTCTKDYPTVLGQLVKALIAGNGTCARNCWRITAALCDKTLSGPAPDLKVCNDFVKAWLNSGELHKECILPRMKIPAVLVRINGDFTPAKEQPTIIAKDVIFCENRC